MSMPYRTFADARAALARGETSCEALVSSFLERIDSENERLNVFTFVDAEGALARARELDGSRSSAASRPLEGLVVAIKDVICERSRPVTCASRILQGFDSLYDATVVARLREAGAIIIGRTNCDEFAMGSSSENSFYGPVRNPVGPEFVAGGSSGGAAAAVAAGMCHVSLGSDTGGSIRQPAAFCGTVGLKPTYGRVSRYGLVAYASSLDCIGPIAHTVEDAAAVLNVIAGRDTSDATSAPVEVPDYVAALSSSVSGIRVGLPKEYFTDGLDPVIAESVHRRVAALERAGAQIQEISLPHTEYGIATYYVVATAEASSNLARYDGIRYGYRADVRSRRTEARRPIMAGAGPSGGGETADGPAQDSPLNRQYVRSRSEGFGDEVKRRIMLGTYVLSSGYYDAYYGKAQRVRALIRQDFERAFENVDVIMTPATPGPAFRLGSKIDDPLEMYLGDVFTVTANLAGIPGIVVPAGSYPGEVNLPIGVQLLGRHFDEALLMQVGDFVHRFAEE